MRLFLWFAVDFIRFPVESGLESMADILYDLESQAGAHSGGRDAYQAARRLVDDHEHAGTTRLCILRDCTFVTPSSVLTAYESAWEGLGVVRPDEASAMRGSGVWHKQ